MKLWVTEVLSSFPVKHGTLLRKNKISYEMFSFQLGLNINSLTVTCGLGTVP